MSRLRRPSAGAAVVALLLASPETAAGQYAGEPDREWLVSSSAPLSVAAAVQAAETDGPGVATASLASLVLPGAGQYMLGQRRSWLYMGLEVAAAGLYLERRRAGGRARDRYRDFAWDRARLQVQPRVDPGFEYFETLTHWPSSGAFDREPALPGVQPEVDEATYNGMIWARARGLFLGGREVPESDPRWAQALSYYEARAFGDGLLWDWQGQSAARGELGRLIERSDDRFRQATTAMGALLANHLIAAADAYLGARGRAAGSIRVVPDLGPVGSVWTVQMTLALRR